MLQVTLFNSIPTRDTDIQTILFDTGRSIFVDVNKHQNIPAKISKIFLLKFQINSANAKTAKKKLKKP